MDGGTQRKKKYVLKIFDLRSSARLKHKRQINRLVVDILYLPFNAESPIIVIFALFTLSICI